MKKGIGVMAVLAGLWLFLPGQAQMVPRASLGVELGRPQTTPYDCLAVYITASANFRVACFDFTIQLPRGVRPVDVDFLGPLVTWDDVFCDSTYLADNRLRFLGFCDLGGDDNDPFSSTRPQRLIRISLDELLVPCDPVFKFPPDPRFGPPYFGGVDGILCVEPAIQQYGPRSLQFPKQEGETLQTLPTEFGIEQNYPNPFNAQSTIQYALPQQSRVTIEVFDILGRTVKTLLDEVRPAGYHTLTWDASNISSGVYFYRMTAGSFETTLRMTILK